MDLCKDESVYLQDGNEDNSENIPIKEGLRENCHFKIIDRSLWSFLHAKYGGREIKRLYVKLSTHYNCVEVFLREVPLIIIPTSNPDHISNHLEIRKVQISKKK